MFIVAQLHAQDIKGYYIGASGQKVEGFFKYGDYNDTPSLKFKTSRDAEYTSLSNDVVEYGLDEDKLKFEKHTVDIDISGNDSYRKNPEWLTHTVFLNLIVDGDTKLYSYTKDYNTKFFFSTKNKPNEVSQLIYKKYKMPDGTIAENAMFRQQLYNAVRCDGQSISEYTTILYDKKQLTDVVKHYNECTGSKSEVYGPKKKSDFKYSVFAGVHSLNVGITNSTPPVDSQSSVTYSFGGEVAYTFPSEKVSFYLFAEYESLDSEVVDDYDQGYNVLTSTYKIKGSALNFVFGPRYNFLLNDNNKIFMDAGFYFSVPFGDVKRTTLITPTTGESYSGVHNEYDLDTAFGLNFGVGYTFQKKYSIAFRYVTGRDFLDDVYSNFKTKISRVGVVVSYTLN